MKAPLLLYIYSQSIYTLNKISEKKTVKDILKEINRLLLNLYKDVKILDY